MGAKKLNETKWSKWYLVWDKSRAGTPIAKIRRYTTIDGKTTWDRYPSKEYSHLDESQVESLMRRLNASFEIDRQAAEARYVFDHTYVNPISLAKFEANLRKQITEEEGVLRVLQRLNDYVFEFFILQCKLPDPSRWHLKEDEWGEFLLAQDLSASTIRFIIATANRFNNFIVQKMYPEMTAPRKLDPIGPNVLKGITEARDKLSKHQSKLISEQVFQKIIETAKKKHPEVIPNIMLCKGFGFRISETLGFSKDKFLKDSVIVNEQGSRVVDGEILKKSVKTFTRRVPYWNMTAKEAWSWVQQVQVMHPKTLMTKVNECLAPYGHTSHDFRRTFITNSFRKAHWKDVMKAAGHVDVRTTMGYDQDDRNLSEELADLD
jgi:integrase